MKKTTEGPEAQKKSQAHERSERAAHRLTSSHDHCLLALVRPGSLCLSGCHCLRTHCCPDGSCSRVCATQTAALASLEHWLGLHLWRSVGTRIRF
jgi:hypothetical protein